MVDPVVSDEVRRLIAAGVTTMDHVDLLFHLGERDLTAAELSAATRFDPHLTQSLLADLERKGFVARTGDAFRITSDRRDRAAIDDLLLIYNARPVTLVRAIYRANV